MSDLSEQQEAGRSATGTVAAPAGPDDSAVRPVRVWAVIGGVLLAFQLYVWIRWLTGPYFHSAPSGPDDPPLYMKVPLVANAVLAWIGLPFAVWWFIIRPWRRERRITLDGMIMVSLGLMFFQDPLLNYLNTWCTYNTWMPNRGSWSSNIPGWVSPEVPGHQVVEPLLTNVPGYSFGNLLFVMVGCAVMRAVKSRRPGLSNARLIGVIFVFNFLIDFVLEGLIYLPTGFYIYPGAIRALSVNAGTYYQWPVYEGVMWGGVLTALCCLRYFTDDRGRTIAERGLDHVRGGFAKVQATRFLAIFAAVSACFFCCYNLPAQWFAMHADPWPADVRQRSYFTGGICGDGTDQPCPDPILPMPTKRSGHIDTDGRLVLPAGAELPRTVPTAPQSGRDPGSR
ncbi:spirocyclase AveC family protein [Nocardia sp. BMG111209]|uniref:spirocyclase AveC family protein n=1 Tax=Nocardia sp. BMG111209 TaxID=1160137 RepID=UPI0003787D28|nr:spirocyclase AveC family protein [Nocardia sp. BMG111209]